jgi:putative ATP-binding cassette transporter
MTASTVSPPEQILLKATVARFIHAVRNLADSEVGGKAKWMFAGLVALLCEANSLNVVSGYVGRNFMTSIADRDRPEFIRLAILYIGVFAASTVVAVVAGSPRNASDCCGENRSRDASSGSIWLTESTIAWTPSGSSPTQTIAEDFRAFTVTTLSFVLMGSSFTIGGKAKFRMSRYWRCCANWILNWS